MSGVYGSVGGTGEDSSIAHSRLDGDDVPEKGVLAQHGVVLTALAITLVGCLCLILLLPTTNHGDPDARGVFFHLSDIHLDLHYDASVPREQHCHASKRAAGGDVGANDGSMGKYGCDTPLSLLKMTLESMHAVEAEPDFILLSGDYAPHDPAKQADVRDAISAVVHAVRERFPSTLVYPVLGNNDFFPDYNAPLGENNEWLLELENGPFEEWMTGETMSDDWSRGGFYTAKPFSNIRIIGLNTVYFSEQLKPAPTDESDPDGQLKWFEEVLIRALTKKEKAIVVAHIPPGVSLHSRSASWQDAFVKKYTALVAQFSDVVKAQLMGHYHRDDLRIVMNKEQPASPIFLAPSLSPVYDNNPTFRLFEYDPADLDIINYKQYTAPLSGSEAPTNFTLEYSAVDEYASENLGVEAVYELYRNMHTDEALFQEYYTHRTGGDPMGHACDAACRASELCAITNLLWTDYRSCNSTHSARSMGW